MSNDLLVPVLLEYLLNTYDRYSLDLAVVKENIRLLGVDADRVYDLIVCETRLDTFASESRKLRELIGLYGMEGRASGK